MWEEGIMSLLFNGLIRLYGASVSFYFDQAAKAPKKAQTNLLMRILRDNADSAFGKAHGFGVIKTETQYRKQIPIRDFEGHRSYVNRILSGEKRILTVADPARFNVTSGTIDEPKYIPVTYKSLHQELNLIGQWYCRVLRDHPGFLDHYRAAIVSPLNEGKTPSGVPYGHASGMMFNRIPDFIRRFYAIPVCIFRIKDYEDQYFLIARCALRKKISFLVTPNPSTFIRLADTMTGHAEEIIKAVHDGKAGRDLSDQPEIQQSLSHTFAPDPGRARYLEEILTTTGALRPRHVWPELKLIACWLGGSVGIQAHKLSAFYGDLPIRDLGYMASEAHITLPYQDNTPSGILAVQTNYYEFIPEEVHGTQDPSVLSCDEIERGKRYAVLLTTSSGLYRYDINDIVEVTGFYHRTPLLAFIRKGEDMTNVTGEKMHANHLLIAMEEVRREFNLPLEQFRAAPDFENSRYCIYIELSANMSEDVLRDKVIPLIDQVLAKVNVEYMEKRKSKRLRLPYLAIMQRGWSEAECRKSVQSGVQFKWRVLCAEAKAGDKTSIIRTIESGKDANDRSRN
jgi:hypothetical protein